LSICIDADQEESAILSARGSSVQRGYGNKGEGSTFKGSARVSVQPSNGASGRGQVLRGSGRGPGFIARVKSEGLMHAGRGVDTMNTASGNRGAIRRECTTAGTRDSDVTHAVISVMWLKHAQCQMVLVGGELIRETDRGFRGAAPLGPGSVGRLYRVSDRSNEYGHVTSR
jgi:hypothetical protein